MNRKLLLFLIGFLTLSTFSFAQSGAIRGKIIDGKTKEPIPFANVIVENNGTQAGGASSDFDGNYTIKPVQPGKYDVKASVVGYAPITIRGFIVRADKTESLDIEMESTTTELTAAVVKDYKVPLISKDNTVQGGTVTSEEIAKMPSRSAASVATSVGGVFTRDGEVGSVRGQREEGNVMYIDGIKVRGSSSLPESAIEQVSVILGGVPAQYGDATGGIISVTTKGPSRTFGGGLELQTSKFLDPFGHHRVGANFTGPIFRNKTTKEALVGYFVAADFEFKEDGSPLATGVYVVKDEKLEQLKQNPVNMYNGNYEAMYITKDDLYHSKSTLNTNSMNISTSAKFDIKAGKNANITLGGSYYMYNFRGFNLYNSMFNYDNNALRTGNTWRTFGRYTLRFPNNPEGNSLLKNVYLTVQADYSQYNNKTQDVNFKDNLFAYGHVGVLNTYREPSYEYILDTTAKQMNKIFGGYANTSIDFTPSEYNPLISKYTTLAYELHPNMRFKEEIFQYGGLLNGYNPNNRYGGVYGLYGMPGAIQSGYSVSSGDQISASFNISADIKDHELKFGFQFEKQTSGFYSYAPSSFWRIMSQNINKHIAQLNLDESTSTQIGDTTVGGVLYPVYQVDHPFLFDTAVQTPFDFHLREAMGIPVYGTEWIDFESYDPLTNTISYYTTNFERKQVKLSKPINIDFISPDELLGASASSMAANAAGYDFYGNKFKGGNKPTITDFFEKRDKTNRYFTRNIFAYEPIYMAFYLQDKFFFEDLVFNVGVRVDRFDANQPVLKDPYSLFAAKTVGQSDNFAHPSSIGKDYFVYVDKAENPSEVKGYRDGSTWYDAQGNLVLDPEKSSISTEEGLIPYFAQEDKIEREKFKDSFGDYKPQWTVMPRISFSFPVTDEALFYAHYDIITQRPKNSINFSPLDYLYWASAATPTLNNPSLKPERNVNYELGYQQKLTNTSSINVSGFYIESRDQIQSFRYTGAYPKTYYSYQNIDFGTVKGATISYDLRRTGNTRLRASYTLQFANGTGSDPETSKALIMSGQPNLRNLFPLAFDRRHSFVLNVDYRYGEGREYNGPKINGRNILENAGFNITMNGGSGTPYTRSSKVYPLTTDQKIIEGSFNGSRMPWTFRFDGRLDKDFTFATSKDKSGKKKNYYMNVYLQVLNILNSKNIMSVYPATGNADDDGYLTSDEHQTEINNQLNPQTYRDLYEIRVNNPYHYSSPRMMRIGVTMNF